MHYINFITFFYRWFTGKLYDDEDIAIGIFGWYPVLIMCSKTQVREILKNNVKLEGPYQAFNNLVQHRDSIICEGKNTTPWSTKHQLLSRYHTKVDYDTLAKNGRQQYQLSLLTTNNLTDSIQNYVEHIWYSGCFGSQSIEKCREIKTNISKFLDNSFHGRYYWRIPLLGPFFAKMIGYKYQKQLDIIYQSIQELLDNNNNHHDNIEEGWFQMMKRNESKDLDRFIIESAFHSFLVVDFLNESCLEYAFSYILGNNITMEKSVGNAFFYPWRMRRTGYFKWSFVNLLSSECYWSYGPRSCIGVVLSKKIMNYVVTNISPLRITLINTILPHRPNNERRVCTRPIMIKNIDYDLPVLPFIIKDNIKLYHINSIFWDPVLCNYIVMKMTEFILQHTKKHTHNKIVIVSPEARGWCLSSTVAYKLNVPLVLIRKKGKEKGAPIVSIKYTTVYSEDEFEMAKTSPLYEDSQVIVIDDGIASGGSADAICKMITNEFHVKPMYVLAVFNHCYNHLNNNDRLLLPQIFTVFNLFQS